MNWRTDFENMPHNGDEFFALIKDGGKLVPAVLYRSMHCLWSADYDDYYTLCALFDKYRDSGCELLSGSEVLYSFTEEALRYEYVSRNETYATFWYTREGNAYDKEFGGRGDSRVLPENIVAWMLPPTIEEINNVC